MLNDYGPRDTHLCVSFKREFDAWLVSVFGREVCMGVVDAGQTWPRSWPSAEAFGAHLNTILEGVPMLPPPTGIELPPNPTAMRCEALEMLTLGPSTNARRGECVTPVRWRDEALARMLLSAVQGDVVALAMLAILDVFGVTSSHTHGRSLVRLYVKLLCRASVSESEASEIVFMAHATKVAYQHTCWESLLRHKSARLPAFTTISDIMNMLLTYDPDTETRSYRTFPATAPLFITAHGYTAWPHDLRNAFDAYCEGLEVNSHYALPEQITRVLDMKRQRDASRVPPPVVVSNECDRLAPMRTRASIDANSVHDLDSKRRVRSQELREDCSLSSRDDDDESYVDEL